MKTASLPRWLARLFTFLFYGQLALCLFGIPALLLELPFQAPEGIGYTPSYAGGTVVIDSIRVGGKLIAALRDTTGTFNSTFSSKPAALTIASVNQVDSTFQMNLNADHIITLDGYLVSRPRGSRSVGVNLPLGGRLNTFFLEENENHPETYVLPQGETWYHRLQFEPLVKLEEPYRWGDYNLNISLSSLAELVKVPGELRLALFILFLPGLFVLLVTYQFMKLFSSLARHELFSDNQLGRVRYIGYYALLYVGVRAVSLVITAALTRRYVRGLGYKEKSLFSNEVGWSFTVEWSWLLMGLCILALAQVFKYGMELKQESELTI